MERNDKNLQSDSRDRFLPIFGWVMYDFSNTIFSALIATRYFPPYLNELTGGDTTMGVAMASSMVASALVVPFLGALADRTGKTKYFLCRTIVLCCLFTMALFVSKSLFVLLPAFFLANMAYQVSLVFYNSLLPEVASPGKLDRVNGIGVGVGYLGALFAYPVAHVIFTEISVEAVFLATGIFVFLLSLPLFLFVPERKVRARSDVKGMNSLSRVFQTVRSLPATPKLLFFLVGNFFCVDALNTVIIFLAVYLKKGAGFSEGRILTTMTVLTLGALVNGFFTGILTRRIGSHVTYILSAGVLLSCIILTGIGLPPVPLIIVLAAGGSFGLAGIWVAGRKYLLEVAPPERVGEFFGFYGITGKLSIVEVFLFATLADLFSYRVAILSLSVTISIGILFILLAGKKASRRGSTGV